MPNTSQLALKQLFTLTHCVAQGSSEMSVELNTSRIHWQYTTAAKELPASAKRRCFLLYSDGKRAAAALMVQHVTFPNVRAGRQKYTHITVTVTVDQLSGSPLYVYIKGPAATTNTLYIYSYMGSSWWTKMFQLWVQKIEKHKDIVAYSLRNKLQ